MVLWFIKQDFGHQSTEMWLCLSTLIPAAAGSGAPWGGFYALGIWGWLITAHSFCLPVLELSLGFGGKYCVQICRNQHCCTKIRLCHLFFFYLRGQLSSHALNSQQLGKNCVPVELCCNSGSAACETPEASSPGQTFAIECPNPNPECPGALPWYSSGFFLWGFGAETSLQLCCIYLQISQLLFVANPKETVPY